MRLFIEPLISMPPRTEVFDIRLLVPAAPL